MYVRATLSHKTLPNATISSAANTPPPMCQGNAAFRRGGYGDEGG
jgi:hypothetical protein